MFCSYDLHTNDEGLETTDRGAGVEGTSPTPGSMEEYIARIPSDKVVISTSIQIAAIAEKIKKWESIAPYLGLSDPRINEIKNDHQTYEEQKLVMKLSLITVIFLVCCR